MAASCAASAQQMLCRVFPGTARQRPHGSELSGKGPLSCTFYHTHSEKSLSCAWTARGTKKKVLLMARAMVTAGHEALPCAYHGDAGQTFSLKNKKSIFIILSTTTQFQIFVIRLFKI
jgi:hypothetical protein